jgi:hypothetical protein
VSKETTKREIIAIGNKTKQEFMYDNINSLFGPVTSVSYCTSMFDFPTVEQMLNDYKKKKETV